MWKNKTYSQRLQNKAKNEGIKCSERTRYRYKRRQTEGFWERSQVDTVQRTNVSKEQN